MAADVDFPERPEDEAALLVAYWADELAAEEREAFELLLASRSDLLEDLALLRAWDQVHTEESERQELLPPGDLVSEARKTFQSLADFDRFAAAEKTSVRPPDDFVLRARRTYETEKPPSSEGEKIEDDDDETSSRRSIIWIGLGLAAAAVLFSALLIRLLAGSGIPEEGNNIAGSQPIPPTTVPAPPPPTPNPIPPPRDPNPPILVERPSPQSSPEVVPVPPSPTPDPTPNPKPPPKDLDPTAIASTPDPQQPTAPVDPIQALIESDRPLVRTCRDIRDCPFDSFDPSTLRRVMQSNPSRFTYMDIDRREHLNRSGDRLQLERTRSSKSRLQSGESSS